MPYQYDPSKSPDENVRNMANQQWSELPPEEQQRLRAQGDQTRASIASEGTGDIGDLSGKPGFKSDASTSRDRAAQVVGPQYGYTGRYGGGWQGTDEQRQDAYDVARREQQYMRDQAQGAQGRTGPTVNMGGNVRADRSSIYGALNTDYKNAMGLARGAAEGTAPSVAAIQQQRGIEDAMRSQATMAASVGGSPLAQAAAAQNAQSQAGMLAQRGVADASMLRAQEMATARQQYGAMSDAYTSQLQNLRGQELGASSLNAQLAGKQGELNDRMTLGYEGLLQGQNLAQMQAQQAAMELEMKRQGIDIGESRSLMSGVASGASSLLGGLMTISDMRAKQGIQPAMAQDGITPRSQGFMPQGGFANPYQAQGMRALQGSGLMSDVNNKSGITPDDDLKFFEDRIDSKYRKSLAHDVVRSGDQNLIKKSPIDSFNRALADSAATYSYKNPAQEPRSVPTGGKYAGVMAQALEKVPEIGPQLVSNTPRGKALEMGAVQSAALAGMGRQQQQLDSIQQKLSALGESNQAYVAKANDPSQYDAFAKTKQPLTPEEEAFVASMLARGGQ